MNTSNMFPDGLHVKRARVCAATGISLATLLLATSVIALAGPSSMPSASAALTGATGKIAFVSDRDGNEEIYVMNPDGSGQTRLTTDPAADTGPSWSPDGSRIAFASDRDGNREIYVMNPDGSGQTRLTSNPAADGWPRWSPDGNKIIFASDRDGNSEIYVMDSDGSGATNLTNNAAHDNFADWSPDGSRITFTSDRGGVGEIYVMNADGTDPAKPWDIRDMPGPARAEMPAWSPDGTKIGFVHIVSQRFTYYSILVMNADGTGVAPLPIGSFSSPIPAWSPDGTMMAFSGAPISYAPLSTEDAEIHAINIDGTGLDALTDNEADDTDPDWGAQPATKKLVITSLSIAGGPLHMWATVRAPDGALLKSGFTPLAFAGSPGAEYKVSVANYFGKWFDRWQDDGSASKSRMITLDSDTTLTALYRTGKMGFTPMDISGRGPIIIDAVSLEDGRTLHMWTITFATRFEAYSVKVHDYKDRVFDHWEDGSTDRVRSVVDAPPKTLTAYYRAG